MKIFIPSYKRAGKVLTRNIFPQGIIACHKFEEKEYKEKEGGKLLVVPDKLRGNIAKVRNYILDNAKCKRIVMIDDDVKEIGYHEKLETNSLNTE